MEQNQSIGELIPINESNGKRAVNARHLHAFLESKQDFSTWIKDRIKKYEFVENQDFITAPQIYGTANGGHSTRTEYALTIGMAKELSMVENNKKGKMARQYFIRCEEVAKKKEIEKHSISSKTINAKISWIKGYKSLLRLNENSTLKLLKQVGDPLGLPTPSYSKSVDQLLSATELLKRNKKEISAQKFNKLAAGKGYLSILTRNGFRGNVHEFYSITDKGKAFGENQVSPNNPKETQPQWYVSKFGELLKLLEV